MKENRNPGGVRSPKVPKEGILRGILSPKQLTVNLPITKEGPPSKSSSMM